MLGRGCIARALGRAGCPTSRTDPADLGSPPPGVPVLTCSNCAATIDEHEAEPAGWRYWSDGVRELHPFCEICSAREFAPDAPAGDTRCRQLSILTYPYTSPSYFSTSWITRRWPIGWDESRQVCPGVANIARSRSSGLRGRGFLGSRGGGSKPRVGAGWGDSDVSRESVTAKTPMIIATIVIAAGVGLSTPRVAEAGGYTCNYAIQPGVVISMDGADNGLSLCRLMKGPDFRRVSGHPGQKYCAFRIRTVRIFLSLWSTSSSSGHRLCKGLATQLTAAGGWRRTL